MTLSVPRVGVVLLLLIGCQALSSCGGGLPASPISPDPSWTVTPAAPQLEGGTFSFSMSIVSMTNPFDCVLRTLNASGAAPQNLRVTINGTESWYVSQHFGSVDATGSAKSSETDYELTTPATSYRWYGFAPPSPVRDGVCPQEFAEYVITYARLPVELMATTAATTPARVDLVTTATRYSDKDGWVPFGETRVVANAVHVR